MSAGPRLTLSAIRIHPLKSGRALLPAAVEVDEFGPRHDRRWLAVDPDGVFLSQRDDPALARVAPSLAGDRLSLDAPGLPTLEVPAGRERRTVEIWGDRVAAVDCGDAAAEWMTAALGRPARLVHFPDEPLRPVPAPHGRPGDRVSFADAFPFLLLTRASVDDLNRRLAEPVPVERFRPNLVIEGAAPYEEDTWRRIRIGDVVLDVVKPCARCVITTTDQATGARDATLTNSDGGADT